MDIFNTPYLYAKRYVTKTMLPNDIFVFPRFDAERDDKYQNYIISYPDLVASIAANIPGAGVTSVTLNNFNPLFTVANTGTVTDPIFTFTAVPQNANLVYAGPAAGPAAAPTFRALTLADMPAGIDAQNLANVLSVGNSTGDQSIVSPNTFVSLNVYDSQASLIFTDGVNTVGQFFADVSLANMTWTDGSVIGDLTIYVNRAYLRHTYIVEFDAPTYKYTQLTADTATYINASNDLVSIAPTTDGDVFTLAGGIPTWAPLPGSTLATCQLDFYVTNINACSPLNILPATADDVYMVMGGGNVGIGTTAPGALLHVVSPIDGEGTGTPMLIVESTGGGIRHNYVSASTYATQIQYYDGTDLNAKFYVGNGGVALMYMEQYQFRQLSTNNKWLGINTVGDVLIGDPADIYTQTARLHVLGSDATAANYGFKVGDNVNTTNFFVRNDGAVSSTLGYWISNNRILHQQGSITSIYCGVSAGAAATVVATFNTALGFNALSSNTAGTANVALGFGALASFQGSRTVAIGQSALGLNISGGANTAVGDVSLANSTGDENTALGFLAGQAITTGSYNTFIGSRSGFSAQVATTSYSIAIGYFTHTTVNNQCVIGEQQGFGHISEFVLGYGPDQPAFTIGDTMIRPTNVSVGVTDIANDYNIIYAGGRGTGTGKGSDIIFKIAPAGLTGSTQNPLLEALRIKNTGVINISNIPTAAGGLVAGDIWSNLGVLTIV